jgi:hypothetical protein
MLSAGYLLLISLTLFLLFSGLVYAESRRGERLILARYRNKIDHLLDHVIGYFGQKIHFFFRHIVKLSWYYSIHSALRTFLTLLVRTYDRLEEAFNSNRERAKVIRAEKRALKRSKNHLTEMAEHKVKVELSPAEKKQRKDKSLRGH